MIRNSKYIIALVIIGLCITNLVHAATRVAVANGNWGTASTWDCNCVPTNADIVQIPSGITVTYPTGSNLSSNNWNKIQIYGTLNVADNVYFDEWTNDSIIVETGGRMNITGDLRFNTNNTVVRVKEGGSLYAANITEGGSNNRTILNYGYIELSGNYNTQTYLYNYATGSIKIFGSLLDGSNIRVYNYGYIEVNVNISNDGIMYNYLGGLILVHGSINGSSSLTFNNDGIVTIDNNLNLVKTIFNNSATGMLIVFGEIYVGEGSRITNAGLVQCVDFRYAPNTLSPGFDNTGGTFIVQDEVKIEGSNCPGCSDKLGRFYYGIINVNTASCTGYPSCSAFLGAIGIPVILGRRLWLNSSFIGYGLQANDERIYQWFDLANWYGFKMAQPVVANRPYLKNNSTDNVNFNPVMSFEGSNLNMDLDNNTLYGYGADGGVGIFAVVIPKNNTLQSVFDYGLSTTKGFGLRYDTENLSAYTPTAHGGFLNTSTHTLTTTPSLITQTSKWGGNQILYQNGAQKVSNSIASMTKMEATEIAHSATATAGVSGPFTLGGRSDNPTLQDFEGKLAELIIYAIDVNEATRKSTESFLALKYGITLPYDYTDFDGNTIYSVDATYKNGIVGIGRQDLNHLHQRQSKSLASGENLMLCTGTPVAYDQRKVTTQVAADKSFFVCGHNGLPTNNGTRVYKATTRNFNQQVTLSFKFTGIDAPYPTLTIDNVDTFTGSPVTVTYDSYDGNYLVYKYTFPNNATRYFKVGAVTTIPREPGVGINTTAIDTSAQLHVYSTNKGVLIPNLTTAQMNGIASPPTGLLIYNTTQNRYMFNAGTPASPAWSVVGRFITNTSAQLGAGGGTYVGEIRYNTTTNTLWYWNGTSWKELLDN